MSAAPILQMPPFPGARVAAITFPRPADDGCGDAPAAEVRACLDALAAARVGGTFWAELPVLDPTRRLIAVPADDAQAAAMEQLAAEQGRSGELFLLSPARAFDPWPAIEQADAIWCDAGDPIALLAGAAGRDVRCFGDGLFARIGSGDEAALIEVAGEWLVRRVRYVDPFSGEEFNAARAIALLGFWRGLIDANRDIAGAAGFARWKRGTVEPLLWGGTPVRFIAAGAAGLADLPNGGPLALWKSKVPAGFPAEAERRGHPLIEVEDGFIRSAGLGADCVPPLSIVVDRLGAHFDPAGPSELEHLLEVAEIDADTLAEADRLRAAIIASGVGKYGAASAAIERPAGQRRHVLVTGQVEDDRSVLAGGGRVTGNLDLLRRVRACEPDAYILYKPHPDIEAGHRKGHVPPGDALAHADAVVADQPIAALIAMVDHVHVLTSLAGFEALIRVKPVTTHGTPFYAGWGLTDDRGDVPARRTRRRSIAELIAVVLMLYPRYLDPVTGLPCPAEVLVDRLAAGQSSGGGAVTAFRRLQGAVRRRVTRMIAA